MRAYTPNEVLRCFLGQRWIVLVPFAIGLAAAPLLARYVPEKYRSETLIMVVPQRVPDAYVKATVTESIEGRLPSISEQILSRSRLERIITDMSLYADLRARMPMEDVVQAMRNEITVTLAANRDSAASFRVAYVSHNAAVAQAVTERLASLYIEQNLRDRENQATSTSDFLATQLEEAKRRLVEQEKKLEVYRRNHAGELPTQLQGNLQSIQNANVQLQGLHESMNRALERRLLIERQIADSETLPVESAPVPATADAALAGSTRQRLQVARNRLNALLQYYTANHPEVVVAQRTVDELEQRLAGEQPSDGTVQDRAASPAELAQRKRILDLKSELAVIERQLSSNRSEEERLKQVVTGLQAKVDVLPSRESELVELTRDYGTLQAAYTSLLTKREDSAMAASLEKRQIGEQFRVVDPASLPERPSNGLLRLGITASGAVVGLILGVLVVGFREFRDTSFRSEDEVLSALSLPVLALIPAMASSAERNRQRWRQRSIDLAGTLVLLAAGAVVIIWRAQS